MKLSMKKQIATALGGIGFLASASVLAYTISRMYQEERPLWETGAPAGHYETLDEYLWKSEVDVFIGPNGKTIRRTFYSDERPYATDAQMLCWDAPVLETTRGAQALDAGSCIERVIADSYQGGIGQYASPLPRLRIVDTQQR